MMETYSLLRILLVEDNRQDAEFISEMLQNAAGISFEVVSIAQVKAMLRLLEMQQFHALMISYEYLRAGGDSIINKVRQMAPSMPILITIHLEDDFVISTAEQLGADDYLVKNYINKQSLLHSIHSVIQHRRMVFALTKLIDHHLDLYDALTGLPNRSLLLDRLHQTIHISRRNHEKFAVLLFDLDDTHSMNQELGRDQVDVILREVSKRLSCCVHSPDTSARFAGDKFVVLLTQLQSTVFGAKVAQVIQRVLSEPITLGLQPCFFSISVGIALYPEDGDDSKHLLEHVEQALFEAKQRGQGCMVFYQSNLQKEVEQQLYLEKDLRLAWAEGQFSIYYQPQIDLSTSKTMSIEAILRWEHPEKGLIDDEEFLRIAEDTGLLLPLNDWMLRTLSRQYHEWGAEGIPSARFTITIPSAQFYQAEFWTKLRNTLRQTNMPGSQLMLQVSEKTLSKDRILATEILHELKAQGMGIIVNDYGSEHTSLGFLRQLPVDILKLDEKFFYNFAINSSQYEYAKATIALGLSLQKDLMASNVDSYSVRDFIIEQRVRYVQGSLFSAAVPLNLSRELISKEWQVTSEREQFSAAQKGLDYL